MIVEKLIKNKKSYTIIVENKSYELDEEIIVEYRLVEGKEITNDILSKAVGKNRVMSYYYKALDYALKYGKNSAQLYDYLEEKGLSNMEIAEVISLLKRNSVIDDNRLIKSITESYIRKSYGILYIEAKLFERKFKKDEIDSILAQIDMELYQESLNKLYEKIKFKYTGTEYERLIKIKKYLLSRGYTYTDINALDIKTNL